jgi:hypothetical protein
MCESNHAKPIERDWKPPTPTPHPKKEKRKTFSKQYTHGFSIEITKDCQQKFLYSFLYKRWAMSRQSIEIKKYLKPLLFRDFQL